jgi:hypothetical protein
MPSSRGSFKSLGLSGTSNLFSDLLLDKSTGLGGLDPGRNVFRDYIDLLAKQRERTSTLDFLNLLLRRQNIFISYHHGEDQQFYDKLAEVLDSELCPIVDRSVESPFESEDPDYIMQRIREDYITGTSCTIVLCGRDTPWRKYIDWEIKATLDRSHGLLGIYLPTARRTADGKVVVPARLFDNWETHYARWTSWEALTGPAGLQILKMWLESAKTSPDILIKNDRPLMKKNGSPPSDLTLALDFLSALNKGR